MNIEILHLIEGAKKAKGLTVIIDVFRAFTTACYVFSNGAEKIIPVGNIEIAYKLKKENPEFILMGERGGIKQPGFDYGNSPTHIEQVDFSVKTVVHTTSAGTQGIVNATYADEIITGSFVNADAVIKYILKRNPQHVSLVAMGNAGIRKNTEDSLFAEYVKNMIERGENNFTHMKQLIRQSENARKFFDSSVDWAPERDFELCMDINKFNYVLKVAFENEELVRFEKILM